MLRDVLRVIVTMMLNGPLFGRYILCAYHVGYAFLERMAKK
jgi:hypothetical protein